MSLNIFDFLPATLDAFDERHAANRHARAVCRGLIVDDDTSAAATEANLEAGLNLIVGSLLTRQTRADVVMILRHLAKQVARDGIVVQRGRIPLCQ